jgi:hypothetical protein
LPFRATDFHGRVTLSAAGWPGMKNPGLKQPWVEEETLGC